VYAPPGAAPDPVFPASPGAAHAPVVWQERSGPTILDSEEEKTKIIFFLIEEKKTNMFVLQLSKDRRKTNLFVPKLLKERRQTKVND